VKTNVVEEIVVAAGVVRVAGALITKSDHNALAVGFTVRVHTILTFV